jgi:hypothetical protein
MYRLISEQLISDVNGSVNDVCVLGIALLFDYLIVLQTLASLRIEIDNYIIQRQRAEERLTANVSFKHQSLLFLFVDKVTNSFKKTPK